DRYDESTRILIGQSEDGSGGEARVLREKIEAYARNVQAECEKMNINSPEMPFDFSDRFNEDLGWQSWEMYTFYDTPLAAVAAILSKLKNDVRSLEYNAVNGFFARIDGDDIPIDTVLAKVIPRSNFVVLGEQYEADIFLGAYSTTSQPQVYLGESEESLSVEDGMGKYSIRPTSEGEHSFQGRVTVLDKQGNPRDYEFASSYIVSKPLAVVSPTKMNVLYIGPDNPLAISVPGIADDQVSVRITGGNSIHKVAKGEFVAKLKNGTTREVEVVVSANLNDASREMGRMKFRVKSLPEPSFRFGKIKTAGQMTTIDIANTCGKAQYADDFLFDLPLSLVEYRIVAIKDGMRADRMNRGRCLEEENKSFLRALRPGTEFWIEDIKIKDINGRTWEGNPVKVKVKRS
ncbi:MAG: hypothetical protein HKN32_07595, partial [Flavobacteriales bacterium]|nr:hypothetical protein [Flavobacteriales bacterium]